MSDGMAEQLPRHVEPASGGPVAVGAGWGDSCTWGFHAMFEPAFRRHHASLSLSKRAPLRAATPDWAGPAEARAFLGQARAEGKRAAHRGESEAPLLVLSLPGNC